MKFHLLGENTKVEIDVLGRKFSESWDYWNGNWVNTNLKVEIPGYYANFKSSLRMDEINDFVYDLKLMYRNLAGEAILTNTDDYIHFEGEMDRLGHIHWSGEICYPLGGGAVLKFEFVSDQSYLEKLIKELEDIMNVYAIIGEM